MICLVSYKIVPVVASAPSVVGGVYYGGRHVSVGVGFGF